MTQPPKKRGRPPGSRNKPKSLACEEKPQTVRTERKTDHLFKPGMPSPNPAGRPKGSRNKLSENFISALQSSFDRSGEAAIEAVLTESPGEYLRIIASIVPKQFGLEEGTQNAFLQVWLAISEGRA